MTALIFHMLLQNYHSWSLAWCTREDSSASTSECSPHGHPSSFCKQKQDNLYNQDSSIKRYQLLFLMPSEVRCLPPALSPPFLLSLDYNAKMSLSTSSFCSRLVLCDRKFFQDGLNSFVSSLIAMGHVVVGFRAVTSTAKKLDSLF